ncbi:uncharacterized protein LOC113324361 [Papaver somniferum]|uniref:uncharacterized protein LOC113324361 n=1 Tax=Papaver somniferum TaxID=3469 RepID=UPI000E6FE6FF|nr:uncharacterized protein LOC113324361 [Papaver somniferum]
MAQNTSASGYRVVNISEPSKKCPSITLIEDNDNNRPENQRTSHALVWISLPGLSLEYWDEKTLFTICNAIGNPVKVDDDTLKYSSGYAVKVLVEVNLANPIPNKLWIITKYGGFSQGIVLIKLPKFCYKCKIERPIDKAQENIVQEPFDICPPPEVPLIVNPQSENEVLITNVRFSSLQDDEMILGILVRIHVTSWSRVVQKPLSPNTSSIDTIPGAKVSNGGQFNPPVVWIVKPKVFCFSSICNKLNLPGMQNMVIHNPVSNNKGNIWLFWNKNLPTPTIVSMSSQMITVDIGGVLISRIRAHVGIVQRIFLWSEMEAISGLNKPWMAIGDFNAITSADEKIGGKSPKISAMTGFNNCLDTHELMQAPKTGLQHSWSNCQHGNKRILCNLDRAVFNVLWLQKFEGWGYKFGLRVASDHAPLLGGGAQIPKPQNAPMRFQKM